jgi:hypothetical protein
MLDVNSPSIGRFDKSFLIHMIKDFFLILVLVTLLEFSLKAALVYWNFAVNGETEAGVVADDLADNVRSIMRNEGGPVAARTIYPILDRNWTDLGYLIAIEPAEVTVRSIEETFGFVPAGVPAKDWPEGRFQAATVEITAETFCLDCHYQAEVGDVLGTITVRNYLSRDFALWFKDVQLTAGLAVGKIVLHSILLFLILRARLEPLMGLRSTVSNLARAYGTLNHRAEIRTADEFGALARDLNLFLDRIGGLVGELDAVMRKVVSVNDDIISIQSDLRERIDGMVSGVRHLERDAMLSAKREPRLSNAWFEAMRQSVEDLATSLGPAQDSPRANGLVQALRDVIGDAEAQIRSSEMVFEGLATLGDDSEKLRGAMSEMTRLEERLKAIIESCGTLVGRLQPNAVKG